jgi:hypothetical protein
MSQVMQIGALLSALATLGFSASAAADAEQAPVATGSPLATEFARSPAASPFGAAIKPVDVRVLERRRGGTDVINDSRLKGVVSNNQAINVTTGGNIITEGAFAGTQGLPLVVQNSGNNVLIQNATIVNVQVK